MKRIARRTLGLLAGASLALAGCADEATTSPTSQAASNGRYIVKFHDASRGKAAVASLGGALARDLPGHSAAAYHMSSQAAAALANNPHIDFVEVDQVRKPLSQTTPYGIQMVQATQVAEGTGIADIKVCIIDSGYAMGHEDLQGTNVTVTPDIGSGDVFDDTCGHGTHVAGTIAALNNDTGVVGVTSSGSVGLHIVKVFGNDAEPCAWSYSSDLIAASDACAAAGANIISMSLGCSGGPKNGPFACASRAEENAFNTHWANGILSIAAAGNDGNTEHSYPASYSSVVSVAAIDENGNVASFSQQTDQVEVAAPGVGVLSTLPTGSVNGVKSFTVGGTPYAAEPMDGTPGGTASGALVDCGLGDSVCTGATGAVCLIQRGSVAFSDKVLNCQNGGGVAAVVYNNEPGMLYGTLGGISTTIPSVGVSDATGATLVGQLGQTAALELGPVSYAAWDGTSMATPHVSGVAALVWSHNPSWTNAQIREALTATAADLGPAGRDNAYGYGLVQAADALSYLQAGSPVCEPQPENCTNGVDDDCDDLVDGDDPDCQASCEPQPENCTNGVDDDCDGAVDAADPDCQTTCELAPLGADCTDDSDCCSNKCKGAAGRKTCK